MSSNNQKIFIGGAAVHKELQGFAAFVAYQNCHESGGSVTIAMLESSIGKQYFGDPRDPDLIGLTKQLVEDTGVFRSLYESAGSLGFPSPLSLHETSTNRASANTAAVIGSSTSILKPSLHCLGGHIAIPVGGANGISLPLLLQSKLTALSAKKNNYVSHTVAAQQEQDDYIKPRTLFTRAQEVAKNGKKALSCVMAQDSPYKDYVKTGNLPSGINHDDYLQFVRKKMFALLNPPKQGQDAKDLNLLDNGAEGTTSTTNSSSMEIDADAGKMFTFAGYIVFALMGPIVENFDMLHYRSDLLMRSTPAYSSTAEKKLAGQSNSRAQQSNMKRKHRRDSDNATNDNGSILTRSSASDVVDLSVATLSECIQAAGIAQSRLAERGKKKAKVNDRKIVMHLKKVTGKQSMIQEQKFLISATAPEDPNR